VSPACTPSVELTILSSSKQSYNMSSKVPV